MVFMACPNIGSGQFAVYYQHGHKYIREEIFADAQLEVTTSEKDASALLVVQQQKNMAEDKGATTATSETLYEPEQRFTVTSDLEFAVYNDDDDGGRVSLTWMDLEFNETYEFICGRDTSFAKVNDFVQFFYERLGADHYDLRPKPLSISGKALGSQRLVRKPGFREHDSLHPTIKFPFTLPKGSSQPSAKPLNYLVSIQADLFIFMPNEDKYVPMENMVDVDMVSFGLLDHWLLIRGNDIPLFSQRIEPTINANFNKDPRIMIWNYFEGDRTYSLLLKIMDADNWQELTAGFGQCVYEASSQIPFSKSCKGDQDFVISAIENDTQLHYHDGKEDHDDNDSVRSSNEEDTEENTDDDDDDDDDDDEKTKQRLLYDGRTSNNILTVRHKDGSAYIFHGNKLGVYQSTSSSSSSPSRRRPKLSHVINDVLPHDHTAQQAMLYRDESSLLVLKSNHHVAQLDLESGKVVNEWGVEEENDNEPLVSLAPNTKYAQTTDEQTLIGVTSNAVFRMDPRLPQKIIQQQCKRHVVKTDFTSSATSQHGHIVVGSRKGDIRLFAGPGRMAKTTLPPLGHPVRSLDTSLDGRYVLATCQYYLMLFDVMHQQQQQQQLGYNVAFGINDKPVPKLLKIRPEHAMLMDGPISFTQATFGAGQQDHDYILTSTGPYVIEWDIASVANGKPYPYRMQKFSDSVMAATYDSASPSNIVVALPNNVIKARRKQFEEASTRLFLKFRQKHAAPAASAELTAI